MRAPATRGDHLQFLLRFSRAEKLRLTIVGDLGVSLSGKKLSVPVVDDWSRLVSLETRFSDWSRLVSLEIRFCDWSRLSSLESRFSSKLTSRDKLGRGAKVE